MATFYILPMLGKHPDEYPRFRDCFLRDEEHPEYDMHIHVYTRTGGGNREGYEEENAAMQAMPGFVADHDDSFDCTFATWVFSVPEKWRPDFDAITGGKPWLVSEAYRAEILRVFPKAEDKLREHFAQWDAARPTTETTETTTTR